MISRDISLSRASLSMMISRSIPVAAWMGGRMDACTGAAECLCSALETLTTSLISYTPMQNKKLKKIQQRLIQMGNRASQGCQSLSTWRWNMLTLSI